MVAGYVDAYGFVHYQTFVSFMSGNTTQSGVKLGLAAAASARFGVWVLVLPVLILAAFTVWGRPAGAEPEGSGECTSQSGSAGRDNLDYAHHAHVLMIQDVTVVDILAGEIEEA